MIEFFVVLYVLGFSYVLGRLLVTLGVFKYVFPFLVKYRICKTNKDEHRFWIEKHVGMFKWEKVLYTETKEVRYFSLEFHAEEWITNQLNYDEKEKINKKPTKTIIVSRI